MLSSERLGSSAMAILKWILIGLIGLMFAAWAFHLWSGMSLKPLDDDARAQAPGAFLERPEGKLHYLLEGSEDGPIIVLSHGFSTPNFIYEQNVEALNAAGFRTLRYDHFGRGWSDRPKVKYDIDFYDRTLIGLLDGLNIEKPVGLVGLSMGGPITAEFTARHPERVSKLFLFVPAGLDLAGADSGAAKLVRTPVIGDFVWRMIGKKTLLGDPQYDESGVSAENRLQGDVTVQMTYRGYLDALLSTLRHMPMAGREATFQALAETGVPVMAVYGDADETVLVSSAGKLQNLLPDADVRIVKGGEHGLNYQRHKEVNPWLLEWFQPTETQ
jgi:pimeloyl-ACP methyl ester carboxylesterase